MTVIPMTQDDVAPSDPFDATALGPFRELWQAWNPAHEVMIRKEIDHFVSAYERQVAELKDHYHAKAYDKATNEAVDMISISLNFMRMLGYTPADVAVAVRDRAKLRMEGQTEEILQNYP